MKKGVLILFVFSVQFIFSQKRELGNVTVEELSQKSHPNDPSAEAAILFNKALTNVEYNQGAGGFEIVTEVETKIKIYNKEGLDWANKSITYYIAGDTKEKVEFSKCVTYNLENGSIDKTKLSREGEFTNQENKYWETKKIVMPNVKEGSIIEYRYIIRSPFITTFPEWKFESFIPVDYSELKARIPEYFTYNVYRKGNGEIKETKNIANKSISFIGKDRVSAAGRQLEGNGANSGFVRGSVQYSEEETTFTMENVPAIKDESYVHNIDNYITTVQHELSATKMPDSQMRFYSLTWEDVVKTIYDSESFGGELNKTNYFDEDLKNIIANNSTSDQKLVAILQFVKQNIKWDGFNSLYTDKGVRRAYKEKTGNVAEINLILTAMLREAGFDANPVLLSTRQNGIPQYPSRTSFNYVIASVQIDGNIFLLDATNKYSSINILPLKTLNWIGRLVRKDGTSLSLNLASQQVSNDAINLMCSINSDGKVEGKLREQYFDYNAFVYRDNNASLSSDSYVEKLEQKYKGIEVSDFSVKNENDLFKPIVESYSFESSNLVEIIGDRMYLSPMLFFQIKINPFKSETRGYPIDFNYPMKDSYNLVIKIPEGYEVETLPKVLNMSTENGTIAYKFNISNSLDTVQIVSSMEINTSIIPSTDYVSIKNFFKEIVNNQAEKIVLKKI
ncbi:DUF3857 domain-containing protein [uncultured Flavobacterium sp.]|uniref:DUF3857 domain-containing protein n=1 Tax=uncultured Flavobacterium sp. TaxID=165435 RepID=UPI0030C7F2C8